MVNIIYIRVCFSLEIENNADLKDAVRDYFGKRPNNAYYSPPGGSHKLYETYDWSPVRLRGSCGFDFWLHRLTR